MNFSKKDTNSGDHFTTLCLWKTTRLPNGFFVKTPR